MVQITDIEYLLELFLSRINTILNAFSTNFGEINPIYKWRNNLIERTGFLDKEKTIEYSFHGAGCTIEFPNGEIVSFDFLDSQRFTFDLFKFKLFVLSKLSHEDEIEKLFQSIELLKENNCWIIQKKEFNDYDS
jgi:hypothetical protein